LFFSCFLKLISDVFKFLPVVFPGLVIEDGGPAVAVRTIFFVLDVLQFLYAPGGDCFYPAAPTRSRAGTGLFELSRMRRIYCIPFSLGNKP
jgi:hypothetical protein